MFQKVTTICLTPALTLKFITKEKLVCFPKKISQTSNMSYPTLKQKKKKKKKLKELELA
jgi:hypothetical protein